MKIIYKDDEMSNLIKKHDVDPIMEIKIEGKFEEHELSVEMKPIELVSDTDLIAKDKNSLTLEDKAEKAKEKIQKKQILFTYDDLDHTFGSPALRNIDLNKYLLFHKYIYHNDMLIVLYDHCFIDKPKTHKDKYTHIEGFIVGTVGDLVEMPKNIPPYLMPFTLAEKKFLKSLFKKLGIGMESNILCVTKWYYNNIDFKR